MEMNTMNMTLGDIVMNIDGADKDRSIEDLFAIAMVHDVSFDATEVEITQEGKDEHAKRVARPFVHKDILAKQKAEAEWKASRRRAERREAMGLNEDGTLPEPKPEEMSATERTALAEAKKKPSRKTVVTAVEDTNPRPKKLTQLEFDGRMDLHRKLYEKTPSGKWVINCAAARTYRHQVWEYNSKQRDEAGELIRTEHPDVKAVQLAAV